jgi:hypothetical protein
MRQVSAGNELEDDKNLQKLKYATEWQVEIGKVLQSFDPVLRPLDDMAKHGITMATVLLGISTSRVALLLAAAVFLAPILLSSPLGSPSWRLL